MVDRFKGRTAQLKHHHFLVTTETCRIFFAQVCYSGGVHLSLHPVECLHRLFCTALCIHCILEELQLTMQCMLAHLPNLTGCIIRKEVLLDSWIAWKVRHSKVLQGGWCTPGLDREDFKQSNARTRKRILSSNSHTHALSGAQLLLLYTTFNHLDSKKVASAQGCSGKCTCGQGPNSTDNSSSLPFSRLSSFAWPAFDAHIVSHAQIRKTLFSCMQVFWDLMRF